MTLHGAESIFCHLYSPTWIQASFARYTNCNMQTESVPVAVMTTKKTSPESQMTSFMKEASIKREEVTMREKAIMHSFFQDGEKTVTRPQISCGYFSTMWNILCIYQHVLWVLPMEKLWCKFLWHHVIIMLRQYIAFSCFRRWGKVSENHYSLSFVAVHISGLYCCMGVIHWESLPP